MFLPRSFLVRIEDINAFRDYSRLGKDIFLSLATVGFHAGFLRIPPLFCYVSRRLLVKLDLDCPCFKSHPWQAWHFMPADPVSHSPSLLLCQTIQYRSNC